MIQKLTDERLDKMVEFYAYHDLHEEVSALQELKRSRAVIKELKGDLEQCKIYSECYEELMETLDKGLTRIKELTP